MLDLRGDKKPLRGFKEGLLLVRLMIKIGMDDSAPEQRQGSEAREGEGTHFKKFIDFKNSYLKICPHTQDGLKHNSQSER